MKKHLVFGLSIAILASASVATNAFAQEKTGAEVRQDAGHQMAGNQQNASGVGAEMSGSGAPGVARPSVAGKAEPNCVGPVSFCTLYFGS
ncbi:hypothetical protein [Paraburkholderia sacchari]|uniref:hypothetical protein n=1 Tax=Paraburkholderia sacchari TaxID=159450 RepID=UPI001BCB9E95|nr:hypothetical protein [Paraburkholderia sacchari]